jgi:DNA-directed RNA polymerase specialized sigma24 family protein
MAEQSAMMDDSLIALRSDASTARLTPEELERLLGCLDPDRDTAARVYLQLHRKLVKYFEWRDVPYAEGLADETLNRLARASEPIRNPAAFAMGVARNVLREFHRDRRRILPDAPSHAEPSVEIEMERLSVALEKLVPLDRELICAYYREGKPKEVRQELAIRMRLTPNALRIRVCRIRDQLLVHYLEVGQAGVAKDGSEDGNVSPGKDTRT